MKPVKHPADMNEAVIIHPDIHKSDGWDVHSIVTLLLLSKLRLLGRDRVKGSGLLLTLIEYLHPWDRFEK